MTGTDYSTKRKAVGLTQEHVEQITGIAQTKISRFETGTVQLSETEIARLVDALEFRLTLSRPVRIPSGATQVEESHP